MIILEHLNLWLDPLARPGPQAMAVDEWLLETAQTPVMRVYQWLGDWGSLGYFGKLAEGRAAFPGLKWVRRWTGGGTVDHRADWTVSVIVPIGFSLAKLRAADSYRTIHESLAEALAQEGIAARLSTGAEETGAGVCFENPVCHDVIDPMGRKLAGAGQRRTKRGLLHQGSVAGHCSPEASARRATTMAAAMCPHWQSCDFHPPADEIARKVRQRYALDSWTSRR